MKRLRSIVVGTPVRAGRRSEKVHEYSRRSTTLARGQRRPLVDERGLRNEAAQSPQPVLAPNPEARAAVARFAGI